MLAERLYGVGPATALALTCWLGGAGRFSSSRKAVRFAGLDITVYSSDSRRSPGRLSRQGPPVLRWAVYEAGKTHPRASAPDQCGAWSTFHVDGYAKQQVICKLLEHGDSINDPPLDGPLREVGLRDP
jgi:transposase